MKEELTLARWRQSVAIALSIVACAGTGVLAPLMRDHAASPAVTALALVAMAVPGAWASLHWLGTRRALALLATLSLYAYTVETVGVATGLPYGGFTYGEGMGPRLGLVPAALPLGYVPLVLGAIVVSWRLAGRHPLLAAAGAALFLVACDAVLDPGAVLMGIWSYSGGGRYYDVPWQNFAGWLVTGLGAGLVGRLVVTFPRLWPARGHSSGSRRRALAPQAAANPPVVGMLLGPLWLLAFWVGVAVTGRMLTPVVVGSLMIGALAGAIYRARSAATAGQGGNGSAAGDPGPSEPPDPD